MLFNTTELEDAQPITEYTKEPTRWETVKASYDNFRSVSLSNSKDMHYKNVMQEEAVRLSEKDPLNKELYDRVANYNVRDIEKLEVLYETNPDMIKGFIQDNPFSADIFIQEDFIKMKELQAQNGAKSFQEINEEILTKAKSDYTESAKILEDSEYWGMELVGTAAGALTDVKTIQTLPLGTWKTGGTVFQNAGRAFLEEMGIEALAQTSIAPEVYAFKKELGLKTSIVTEATNAVTAIAGAGLFRGVGSAAFDLTSKGISKLKAKDPELGAEYEQFSKSQATDDMATHVENMQKVEFGDEVTEIKNPNAKGEELNNAEPILEFDEELIKTAKNSLQYHVAEIPEIKNVSLDAKDKAIEIANKLGFPDYIEDVYIVGSRATGKQRKTSDIDILIKTKTYDDLDKSAEATYVDEAMYDEFLNMKQTININGEEVKVDYFMTDIFENKNVIRVSKEAKPPRVEELKIDSGVDENGKIIYKTYKELSDEVDMESKYIQKAKECFL